MRVGSSGKATRTTRSRSTPMRRSAASTRPAGRSSSARRASSTRHGRRPQRPPDRGCRLAGEPVRPRQGDRIGRRAADAQSRDRIRDRPSRTPAEAPRRPAGESAQDRFGEKSLADATQRIAEIAQDLAQRTPTRGDAFVMTVGERKFAERKTAARSSSGS